MQITLTKQRVAKNGLVSYRQNTKRTTGVVYFHPKMFSGEAPASITVNGDSLRDVIAEEAAEAAAKAVQPAAETVGAPA
jgi:hypothetical protein